MRADVSNKNSVQADVAKVRDVLHDPRLQDVVERAAAQIAEPGDSHEKVTKLLALDLSATSSSGGDPENLPYLSRAPLVSLLQSHIEEAQGDTGSLAPGHPESLWSKLVHTVEHDLRIPAGSFTRDDPDWYVFIAKGALERIADGNHTFNRSPARYTDMADTARLVIVGDWGTGLDRARDVASHMQNAVATALNEGRQVHAIHLGDVYYSGLETEDQRRFLDLWPVTQAQADAGVTSWSLNGNHDMYSGGFGYFKTLLGDPRFAAQRAADGTPTSYFQLRSPSWDFVGLDTAWDSNVVSEGQIGVLEDPQADFVATVAGDSDRKLVLLSHHQLVSFYDKPDVGDTLAGKLGPVLAGDRVTAWWWGHEHRAITYQAAGGVRYPRCLGNGGVPVLPDPDPPANSDPAITWHSTRTVHEDGQERTRFGFAVLDLYPDRIEAQYIDDDGHPARRETVD